MNRQAKIATALSIVLAVVLIATLCLALVYSNATKNDNNYYADSDVNVSDISELTTVPAWDENVINTYNNTFWNDNVGFEGNSYRIYNFTNEPSVEEYPVLIYCIDSTVEPNILIYDFVSVVLQDLTNDPNGYDLYFTINLKSSCKFCGSYIVAANDNEHLIGVSSLSNNVITCRISSDVFFEYVYLGTSNMKPLMVEVSKITNPQYDVRVDSTVNFYNDDDDCSLLFSNSYSKLVSINTEINQSVNAYSFGFTASSFYEKIAKQEVDVNYSCYSNDTIATLVTANNTDVSTSYVATNANNLVYEVHLSDCTSEGYTRSSLITSFTSFDIVYSPTGTSGSYVITKSVRVFNPLWCAYQDLTINFESSNGTMYHAIINFNNQSNFKASEVSAVVLLGDDLTYNSSNYSNIYNTGDELVSSFNIYCSASDLENNDISLCLIIPSSKKVAVNYNLGGGAFSQNSVSNYVYLYDGQMFFSSFAKPSLINYTFIGWYKDSAITTLVTYDYLDACSSGSTVNVYAGYDQVFYTITYVVPNHDTGEVRFTDKQWEGSTLKIAYHYTKAWYAVSMFSLDTANNLYYARLREYDFVGWSTIRTTSEDWDNRNSNYVLAYNSIVDTTDLISVSNNKTLYAIFKFNSKKWTSQWRTSDNWQALYTVDTEETLPDLELQLNEDTGEYDYSGLNDDAMISFVYIYDYTISKSETYIYSSYLCQVGDTLTLPANYEEANLAMKEFLLTGKYKIYGWSTKQCDINIWDSFTSNNDCASWDEYLVDESTEILGNTPLYAVCYLAELDAGNLVIVDGGEADQAPNNWLPQITAAAESAWSTISSWFNDNILSKWTTIWSWLKWVLVAIAAVIVLAIVFKIVRLITS